MFTAINECYTAIHCSVSSLMLISSIVDGSSEAAMEELPPMAAGLQAAGAGAQTAGARAGGSAELGRRLLAAARAGHTALVLELLARGAPLAADWVGAGPLHAAAAGAHAATCAALLRAGASRDARTKVARTALHVAAAAGHASVCAALLARGAAPDPRDMLRMTPLHWAAERGRTQVARLLLRAGADPRARTKFGATPLRLAARRRHAELVALLEDALRGRCPPPDPHEEEMEIPAAEQQRALESIERLQEAVKCDRTLVDHVKLDVKNAAAECAGAGADCGAGAAAGRVADTGGTAGGGAARDETAESGAAGDGAASGGAAEGGAAALLRRHGITLLPPDSSCTVLNALHSGRTVVLSDAGKLMLQSTPPAPAARGVVVRAAAVRTPPAPNVKIFTVNNKPEPQVKLVSAASEDKVPRRVTNVAVKTNTSAGAAGAAASGAGPGAGGAPVKIFLQKNAAADSGADAEASTTFMCVPAEFLSSTSVTYLRAQLLAAHRTIHRLNQEVARLERQLAGRGE